MNIPEESGFKSCGCPAVTTCDHYKRSGVLKQCLSCAAKDARIKDLEGADVMVHAIEQLFPDWKDHRDLTACVRATLEYIRAKTLTAWDQGFREGESKQAILEIQGRERFLSEEMGDRNLLRSRAEKAEAELAALRERMTEIISRLSTKANINTLSHDQWDRGYGRGIESVVTELRAVIALNKLEEG